MAARLDATERGAERLNVRNKLENLISHPAPVKAAHAALVEVAEVDVVREIQILRIHVTRERGKISGSNKTRGSPQWRACS